MVWPVISEQFGEDENIVDIHLERSDSGKSDNLICLPIDIGIFTSL